MNKKKDEFDKGAFNSITQNKNDEKNVLQYIMSGAWFKTKDKNELGITDTNACQLCGEVEEDITHT